MCVCVCVCVRLCVCVCACVCVHIIKANIRYPKYVFLTYGTYEPRWWDSKGNHSEDEQCSSDNLAHTLQYSLAVSHFNTSMMSSIPYHVCYDAVFSLAYALNSVIQDGGSDAKSLSVSEHRQCRYASGISLLVNEQLRNTHFIGNSVSVTLNIITDRYFYTSQIDLE